MELSRIRRMQRYGLSVMALALGCLVVLHNPTAGYQTSITHYEAWPLPAALGRSGGEAIAPACSPPSDAQRDALASQKRYLGQELGQCRVMALDFFEWRSAGALVSYVATIRKVLVIAGAILFVGLGWVWVLADPKLRQPTTPAVGNNASSVRHKFP